MNKQVRYFLVLFLVIFQALEAKEKNTSAELMNTIRAAEKKFKEENFSEAIVTYLKAAEIAESEKDTLLLADIYTGMGISFYFLQNPVKSKEYFDTALKLYSAIRSHEGVSDIWITMGNLAKNDEEALAFYEKALPVKKQLGDSSGVSCCYNNIGGVYSRKNDFTNAMTYYKKALAIDERSLRKRDVIGENINIGSVYFRMKDFPRAIEYYSKGERLAKEAGYQYHLQNAYKALSDAYLATGKYREAFDYFSKHVTIKDSMVSQNVKEKMAEVESKYQLEKKQKEIGLLKNSQQEKELALQTSYNQISEQKFFNLFMTVLSLVILLVTVVLFLQYRRKAAFNQKLTEQNQEIAAQKERIEESLAQNEELRLALQYDLNQYKQLTLRKQMNPHFIFNSLNSIQSFILQNDKLSANLYLSKFAGLTRRVLDNLRVEYVSVKNEIETLKLYVELEQKRFENKFEFHTEIDPGIDTALLAIPPLIFQPYVENAIWHGLLHKDTPGKLILKLTLRDDSLICTIEDNGIGREAAMNIKQNREQKHESHGTDITLKRLELINSINNSEIKVEFTDIKTPEGETGTRVQLTFPVIEILSLSALSFTK